MNISKYRKYIVRDATYCCCANDTSNIVQKGQGFYLTDTRVVTGYQLVSPPVYVPLYSHAFETRFRKLRKEVNVYARFYAAQFRVNHYFKVLLPWLDVICADIIREIVSYLYDPCLLV